MNPSALDPRHRAELDGSGIPEDAIVARGYFTATTKIELKNLGFSAGQQLPPALVIPLLSPSGDLAGYQIKPDRPRVNGNGKPSKYEFPKHFEMRLDVPPGARPMLGDPKIPLVITEGVKKADAAAGRGLCCVALLGVWNWRGTNADGGKVALPEWEMIALNGRDVYVVFDSDVMVNPEVHKALSRLGAFLEHRKASVRYVYLPHGAGGAKVGLDDFLAAGHSTQDVFDLATPNLRDQYEPRQSEPEPEPEPSPRPRVVVARSSRFDTPAAALDNYIATVKRYQYIPDCNGIKFVTGVYAANHLPGDPVWGLAVGAAGSGKTESIMPLTALPDVFPASTMTEASLLSGTSKRDKAKTATGGLLRTIGDFGIILCKDFGSVLSMNRDTRAALLGAFREIFDGSWTRFVGTDGGRELHWAGRVGFIGGCTTDIDTHHSVMASMGERFVLYRLPEANRKDLSRVAVKNSRQSHAMRGEIAGALVDLFGCVDLTTEPPERSDEEIERIVCLADFVSMARSPVERDGYKREIELIPDPEAPTRIGKVLARLLDGLRVVGVDEATAWTIVVKVARDCVPVLRIKVLDLMADGEPRTTTKVTNALGYPRTTIARCCEDLNAHRFLSRDTHGDSNTVNWQITIEGKARYDAVFGLPAEAGDACPEMSEEVQSTTDASDADTPSLKRLRTLTDFSGQTLFAAELTDLDRRVIADIYGDEG